MFGGHLLRTFGWKRLPSATTTQSVRRLARWSGQRPHPRHQRSVDEAHPGVLRGPPAGECHARVIAAVTMGKTGRPKERMPKKKKQKQKSGGGGAPKEGSPQEVLALEAESLLERARPAGTEDERQNPKHGPPEPHTHLELEIEELSSTGDGLAYAPDRNHVYVVPFGVPGDRVRAKTFPQRPNDAASFTPLDFVEVVRPSPRREGVRPNCPYFAQCSGCQLQMLSYPDQLRHKKTIVEKAFRHFSDLDPSLVPAVGDTVGSPLQYGYRTKLTPHYDGPPRSGWREDDAPPPPIGFGLKNNRRVLDIEQCPIGTPILNRGLARERRRVHDTFRARKTGETILLRESTDRAETGGQTPPDPHDPSDSASHTDAPASSLEGDQPRPPVPTAVDQASATTTNGNVDGPLPTSPLTLPVPTPMATEERLDSSGAPEIVYTYPTYRDTKTYTSTGSAFTTEYVDQFVFESRANSFFQNNNSILPTFVQYVRDHCMPTPEGESPRPIRYLLDAYCGSGLFAVCLSPLFRAVLGIDIDALGVEAARQNAQRNHLHNAGFIAASAECLFADVPFPADESLVVIDPPRKGASVDFLRQLCTFGPRRVVYVSCNVHTQARDVGMLVTGFGPEASRYKIHSLRGFDFFPQTGHVEGVCFLDRVEATD